MKEQQRHIDAYNAYYILRSQGVGATDAVREVASQFKVSETSVFRWHKAFDWKGREAIDNHDVLTKTQDAINSALADNKARYLLNLHNAMSDAEARKTISIENMSDYEKATKLALTIQGDEQHDNSEIRGILQELLGALDKDSGAIRTIGVKSRWDAKDK
jgi:hypothetical protein